MEPTVTLDLEMYDNTRKEIEKLYKIREITRNLIPHLKVTEGYLSPVSHTWSGVSQYIDLTESNLNDLLMKILKICEDPKIC